MKTESYRPMIFVVLIVLFIVIIKIVFSKSSRTRTPREISVQRTPAIHLLQGLPFHIRWNLECRNYARNLKEYVSIIRLPGYSKKLLSEIYMPVRLCRCASWARPAEQETMTNIYGAIELSNGPMLIVGEPGSGKSILARYLINRVLDPYNKDLDPNLRDVGSRHANQWFPIFVDLTDEEVQSRLPVLVVNTNHEKAFIQWLTLVTFLRGVDILPNHDTREETMLLQAMNLLERSILQPGYALIVIDSLEQVTERYVDETISRAFMKGLSAFAQSYLSQESIQSNLLVITSRSTEEEYSLRRLNYWELCPLVPTKYTKEQFAQKLLNDDEDSAEKIAQILSSHASLAWFMSNPLILAMSVHILTDQLNSSQLQKSAMDWVNEPFNREQIYREFVLRRWQWGEHKVRIKFAQAMMIMGQLAYRMLRNKDNRLTIDSETLNSVIREVVSDEQLDMDEVKWDMLGRTEYLYPIDPFQLSIRRSRLLKSLRLIFFTEEDMHPRSEYKKYIFQHFTLQEYFAYWFVCHSETLSKAEQKQQIFALLNDVWWREVIIMYLGQQLHTPEWIEQTFSQLMGGTIQYHRRKVLTGIPSEFNARLFDILATCGPFNNDEELKALFVDSRIQAWAVDLPACNTERNRISETVNLLWNQFSADGASALYLFLRVLSERVHCENACHKMLLDLAEEWKLIIFEVDELISMDDLNSLLLLLCVLYEYQLRHKEYKEESSEVEVYKTVRVKIVNKILAQLSSVAETVWNKIPEMANPDVGNILTDEEWRRVEALLDPQMDSQVRLASVRFCERVGGQKAIELLVRYLCDSDETIGAAIVSALQSRIAQVADNLPTLSPEISSDKKTERKVRRTIQVLSASDNPKYLKTLLGWGLDYPDTNIQNEIRKAIVKVGHNQYSDIIDQHLLWYLGNPEAPAYPLVFEAFVEAGSRIIESLLSTLCDPTQGKRHNAIVNIFCEQGKRLAQTNMKEPLGYREMIRTLLFSDNRDSVRYALHILYGTDTSWGVSLIELLCKDKDTRISHNSRLRRHLKALRKSDVGREYYPMIEETINVIKLPSLWDWLIYIFSGMTKVHSYE